MAHFGFVCSSPIGRRRSRTVGPKPVPRYLFPQGPLSAMLTNNLISAETFLSHRGSDCGIANINIGSNFQT